MKVVIFVKGGAIQNILSSNPDLEVEICDADFNPKSTNEEEKEFMERLKECPHSVMKV